MQVCHTKYCSAQCYADSRFGEKVELNGVWIRPGKALEVFILLPNVKTFFSKSKI